MKILGFSDLHRDKTAAQQMVEASADADVVVGAGDFATKGEGIWDTIEILQKIKKPIILTTGNHDNLIELTEICKNWDNVHLLHGDGVAIDGVAFYGLGCAIPNRGDAIWNETLEEDEAAKMLVDCPSNAVLVTHSPPHNCADLQRNGSHQGSEAIAACIMDKTSVLNLCGHIHFSWGASGVLGETPVYNLGPTVNWLEI